MPFHYLQLYSFEVEDCHEYFCTTKIIGTRNVKTVCNIKVKPWSHVSCPTSDFLVLSLRSLIPRHCFCFVDLASQVLGLGSSFQGLRLGPKYQVLRYRSRVFISGPFSNYYKVQEEVIAKSDGYYKVWQLLQSETQHHFISCFTWLTTCHIDITWHLTYKPYLWFIWFIVTNIFIEKFYTD